MKFSGQSIRFYVKNIRIYFRRLKKNETASPAVIMVL